MCACLYTGRFTAAGNAVASILLTVGLVGEGCFAASSGSCGGGGAAEAAAEAAKWWLGEKVRPRGVSFSAFALREQIYTPQFFWHVIQSKAEPCACACCCAFWQLVTHCICASVSEPLK